MTYQGTEEHLHTIALTPLSVSLSGPADIWSLSLCAAGLGVGVVLVVLEFSEWVPDEP